MPFGEGFAACRDRAMILCFYETGVRLSELVGLDLGSVDLQQGQLRVLGKRNKERIIPFAGELRGELEYYLSERAKVAVPGEQALFVTMAGTRVNQQQVYRVVNKRLSAVSSAARALIHCATVLQRRCSTTMPSLWLLRNYWGTNGWLPPKFTRI